MKSLPHIYRASASGQTVGVVTAASPLLPSLSTCAPPEFDGPTGFWSPETLLCASIADCFVLTFRAVSRAAHLDWAGLDCAVEGVLERVGPSTRFTRFTTIAELLVPEGTDMTKARELLERAERGCLIANSLSASRDLKTKISVASAAHSQTVTA